MKTRFILIVLIFIAVSQLYTSTSHGEEQKQIQINTKMNFPEKIQAGETVDFTIDVTYKGPFSWVKSLEPRFDIVPSRASNDIKIQYDESIEDFTIWKDHIHKLHGTLQVLEDTRFEAVYLSVSFEGITRFDEQVVSVDPDSTVSLIIESQDEISDSQTPLEEHYDIEIVGLKEEYDIGEEYSFYFVISGFGYSCANYETKYPDENGNIIGMGSEVLCAPEKSMHEFEFNSLEKRGTLGNVGLKNPGTYTVSVTFDKPSKYYPTKTTKEFRVVESLPNLSPLKQIHSGTKFHNVECNEELVLIYKKARDMSACVSQTTAIELVVRGWAKDSRLVLGCTGERHSKCYPEDPQEYREALYEYYFGSDDYKTTHKTYGWKKYITIAASRIDESLLPDMLKVQQVKKLSENQILTQLIDGANGCKDETEMCALSSGVSIERTNPLGLQVSDHDDYTISLNESMANELLAKIEWTFEGDWIYSVLEYQQNYYFVVLSTFDYLKTPDVEMKLVNTFSYPVALEPGEILNYTIRLDSWATYGAPAKIDLLAVQDAKDSGIKVWVEPNMLEIAERSNATSTLFIQAEEDAKDGIYDVRVIGHANGNLANLFCGNTICPTVNIGNSSWSISSFGSGSGRAIGGIETPENTWLELELDKKELYDGQIAEIKAILVNNSTEKITFTPSELLISVIKTEPVGYFENLYGIEARYESDIPITLEPNSKTLLARPFYWNQTTFHNLEDEQRLDPKQYKIISKFVGASNDWSAENWVEIK